MIITSESRHSEIHIRKGVQIKPFVCLFNTLLAPIASRFCSSVSVRELRVILQMRFACEEEHPLLFLCPYFLCVWSPKERLHSSNHGPKPSELHLSLFFPKRRRKVLSLKDRLVFACEIIEIRTTGRIKILLCIIHLKFLKYFTYCDSNKMLEVQ